MFTARSANMGAPLLPVKQLRSGTLGGLLIARILELSTTALWRMKSWVYRCYKILSMYVSELEPPPHKDNRQR